MDKAIMNFEQQKNRIEENLKYIKTNISKMDGPIFIELMGTAKSGKTTLLTHLRQLFERNEIQVEAKRETAEYNPIQDKDLEEYNVWMIMELMKNLSEDTSNTTPRIIIYDRGMIDRIPWIDFSVNNGSIPAKDSILFKQLYKSDFIQKYKPLTYGFVTSPETSVARKGKEGRLVNRKNVKLFNEFMERETEFMNSISEKYTEIHTDSYQGQIQKFIMDVTEAMTGDIKEIIKRIEFGTVGGETPGGDISIKSANDFEGR